MDTPRTVFCAALVSCLLLAGCAKPGPIDSATALASYADAKHRFAKALNAAVSSDPGNADYRLVAIIGPAYSIGQLLRHDSPSALTKICDVRDDGVLRNTPWAPIPEYSNEYSFSISGSATGPKLKVLSTIPTVSGRLKRETKAFFAYTSLTQDLAYEDAFEFAMLATHCKSAIEKAMSEGRPVVAIRGIINGKERVSSEYQLDTEAKIELLKDQNLTVAYDNKGAYRVEDTTAGPRFYVITMIEHIVRASPGDTWTYTGYSFGFRAPTSDEVQALGGLH